MTTVIKELRESLKELRESIKEVGQSAAEARRAGISVTFGGTANGKTRRRNSGGK
jgi:hypothetical protein